MIVYLVSNTNKYLALEKSVLSEIVSEKNEEKYSKIIELVANFPRLLIARCDLSSAPFETVDCLFN
jgi:hypothetical protein